MKNIKAIFLSTTVFLIISCSAQHNIIDYGHYLVDPGIISQINNKLEGAKGETLMTVDFKLFEDDKVVAESYSKGKSIKENISMVGICNGTITITGFMGMFTGFGYQIMLSKDSLNVTHFAKSDAEIYKRNKTDSLSFGVAVPCIMSKLTLSKPPSFKRGEVVEGIIELLSEEYYEVANGREKKYKMQLTCYFKTEPLKDIEEDFRPPEPVVVQTPETVSTPEIIDSSYFKIKVYDGRIDLGFLGKIKTVKTITEFDKFIRLNKSRIDSNKILLISNADMTYKEMKSVFDLLKKHNYYKFKMVTQ